MKERVVCHVSPDGRDQAAGTAGDPFRTLEAARDAVRPGLSEMGCDHVILLRGGLYPVEEPLRFTAGDSGRNGHRVVYRAAPGETPVLSGGLRLSGWERAPEPGLPTLWKVHLPHVAGTRHLYLDGRRARRARSPEKASEGWSVLQDPDMVLDREIERYSCYLGVLPVHEGYRTTRMDLLHWRRPQDLEFVYDVGWTHSICPVDEIIPNPDGESAFIRMRMPCFRDCQVKGGVQVGSPNYMENAFELLAEPGDWYFDRTDRMLYCIAMDGQDMNHVEAILPRVECLLSLEGTLDAPISDITFEGLAFRHTTWLKPSRDGHAETQANLYRNPDDRALPHSCFLKPQAAVTLSAAHGIAFESCEFRSLGCTALDMDHGACGNIVRGCELADISGTGIQLGGFNIPDAHPDDPRRIVSDNTITANLFHGIGVEYRGGVAILAGFVRRTGISCNEIHDCSYTGISVGWGWGYWDESSDDRLTYKPPADYPRFRVPTVASGNRIERNHVHHVLEKLHDGGGIYTLSLQPDSVIRGNHVHDNGRFDGHRFDQDMLVGSGLTLPKETLKQVETLKGFPGGIYLDEASGGFDVSENIVYHVAVAFNYHDVGMNGRFRTNRIHDNHFNIPPDDPRFPAGLAEQAGLPPAYRHLLEKGDPS